MKDKIIVLTTLIGKKVYEIEIDSRKNYTADEQIYIKAKDGTIYLGSANNSIIIKERLNDK